MQIGIVPLFSPVHDPLRLERQIPWLREIEQSGGFTFEWSTPDQPTEADLKVYFLRTGGTEQEFRTLYRQTADPIYLLVYPGENSLAASLEILAYVRRMGGRGEIIQGTPQAIATRLTMLARSAGALRHLSQSRLGIIGRPSDWLIAGNADPDAVYMRWGTELVDVPLAEMSALVRPVQRHEGWLTEVSQAATSCAAHAPESLDWVQGMYTALQTIRQRYRLNALTLRCFDLLDEFHQTGCLPLARLNDEGIPAGCEGDVPALFSMVLSFYLTGRAAFMSNPASVNLEKNQMVLAHCTVPTSLVTSFSLPTHFESGLGLGVRGKLPLGRCVILRVGGPALDQYWLSGGEIIEKLERNDLCRSQILVQVDEDLGTMLTNPLGNHRIVVPGDDVVLFQTFFDRAGCLR